MWVFVDSVGGGLLRVRLLKMVVGGLVFLFVLKVLRMWLLMLMCRQDALLRMLLSLMIE